MGWASFDTAKVVRVRSPTLAIVYYGTLLGVVLYGLCYSILYQRGYQAYAPAEAAVAVKIKGHAVDPSGRVLDAAELVNLYGDGSFFVPTASRSLWRPRARP